MRLSLTGTLISSIIVTETVLTDDKLDRIREEFAALRKQIHSLRHRTNELAENLRGSGAQRDLANFTRDSALFLYNAEQFLTTAVRMVAEDDTVTQASHCESPEETKPIRRKTSDRKGNANE